MRRFLLLCIPGLLLAGTATAQGRTPSWIRWQAEVAGGLEYDSNATRLDSAPSAGHQRIEAGLFRGTGSLAAAFRPWRGFVWAVSYDLAGKVYFQDAARGQDTLIHRLGTTVGVRLSEGVQLRLQGLYHEGFQREGDPAVDGGGLFDFRLLDGRLTLGLAVQSGLALSASVGGQRFVYKPSESLSFDAVYGGLALEGHQVLGKGDRESDLDLSLSYSVSGRSFSEAADLLCPAFVPSCAAEDPERVVTFQSPVALRRDLVHRLALDVTWVRGLLVAGGYGLVASRSNSYGLGYLRHELTAKLVTHVVWRIYLTLLMRARFLRFDVEHRPESAVDPESLGFEEENRSVVLLQLERRLVRRLRLVLRYSLFVGDLLSPDVNSLRHLAYLGVAYGYRSR